MPTTTDPRDLDWNRLSPANPEHRAELVRRATAALAFTESRGLHLPELHTVRAIVERLAVSTT